MSAVALVVGLVAAACSGGGGDGGGEDLALVQGETVVQFQAADKVRMGGTLLARREDRDGATVYRLDIVLQGAGETVFFNLSGEVA